MNLSGSPLNVAGSGTGRRFALMDTVSILTRIAALSSYFGYVTACDEERCCHCLLSSLIFLFSCHRLSIHPFRIFAVVPWQPLASPFALVLCAKFLAPFVSAFPASCLALNWTAAVSYSAIRFLSSASSLLSSSICRSCSSRMSKVAS